MCYIDFMLSNVTRGSPVVDDPFMSQLWVLRSNADMMTAAWALTGGTCVCTDRGSNKKSVAAVCRVKNWTNTEPLH